MILDCDKYRLSKPAIESFMRNLTYDARLNEIGAISVATMVPIIVVCIYVGELYGFTTELNEFIRRLKEFYIVTEVINIKESK